MEATARTLRADRNDELPVGIQLAWSLRALILTGALASGERLPGVREVAEGAGVNVNTVRSAYNRLEGEGLLVSRHGSGTFVAADTGVSAAAVTMAKETLERAGEAGIDPREVARLLYGAAQETASLGEGTGLPDVGPAADEAAARRELRRQIGRLEAQLASYPEARSKSDTHPLLRPKAHVADIGELEAVRDVLMERLRDARERAERRGKRQSRSRGRRERIISEPRANRWQHVTNDEAGDPGCAEARAVPRFGPIGAVAGWWRVKLSSGCP